MVSWFCSVIFLVVVHLRPECRRLQLSGDASFLLTAFSPSGVTTGLRQFYISQGGQNLSPNQQKFKSNHPKNMISTVDNSVFSITWVQASWYINVLQMSALRGGLPPVVSHKSVFGNQEITLLKL